jgi:redox-sensitive bicupin YhaK (pirin superfamily)
MLLNEEPRETMPRPGPRSVESVYAAPQPHWVGDGFRVLGYFSQDRDLVRKLSPFLLVDYHAPYVYPATENTRRGVGPHPHRGFETVSLAFEGSVAHHDSTGAGGVIDPGDVQWMTAASGILHKEYHAAEFARAGGEMHMMQIWVNLPAADKMNAPGYQHLDAETIGVATLPGGAGSVRVIAGEYAGVTGAARTQTPIDMLDIRLNANGRARFAIPRSENVALLMMKGEVVANGVRHIGTHDLALFAHDGDEIVIEAGDIGAHAMVLAGRPIDEPIAQYGPFVMNTEREIRQAITDFNAGLFGTLAE